ncbi:MAG TPA: VCBS repeat-containing protein, partial [Pyrinomonadaceae bacterium]
MSRRIFFLSLLTLSVCARAAGFQAARPAAAPAAPAAQGRVTFKEVTPQESGIRWAHNNAMSPQRYLPETVGAGCAFFDYDNDGWMDLYLVNSGPSDFYAPKPSPRNALYRNNRDGTFADVTDKAGVAGETFGMGAAAGDYDGDGWQDLFVTSYGRNILYRNRGDGTFADVTDRAGLTSPGWS